MNEVNNILKKIVWFLEKYYFLFFSIILLVAIINLFFHLNIAPIKDWDESRHGISAYEMLQTGNYIVNTFRYEPDYWNLKPPISFWSIMLGYKIVGFNPLGLRLVSAISTLVLIIVLSLFVKYKHGGLASFVTAAVLITSKPFILEHSARTGDADSLFNLFFASSIICLLLMEKNIKWLYLSGFLFSLAFLTKSWHAGSIAIIVGMYLLFTKNILKWNIKTWFMFLFSIFFPILTWVMIRYQSDGVRFFKTMIEYDLLKRSSEPLEGHTGDIWYYVNIFQVEYFFWLLLLVGGFFSFLSLSSHNKIERADKKYTFGILLWVIIPFSVFTIAETKLRWYILPLYPVMALLIGIFVSKMIKTSKNGILNIMVVFIIIFTFCKYEMEILNNIQNMRLPDVQEVLKKLESKENYHGYDIYIYEKGWSQSKILAAELFGDLHVKNGNYKEFMTRQDGLLLLPKNKETTELIKTKKLTIIVEGPKDYIVARRSDAS
ncbi:ArnT family glycosyltransferase [Niallia sp. 01092]|uniref:ArnT family glycosyltransferase n=1 Tax=Niallia sp. 01092 TaxID=3457759 RepID=UPI003FD5B949